MRILFLTPRFPLPAVKGDKLRAWQFIRLLSEAHEVVLLSYVASEEERARLHDVAAFCELETIPFRKPARTAGMFRAMAMRRPFQAALYESSTMREAVRKWLPRVDAVHCNTLRIAGNVPTSCPVPLVVDFIDALSQTYRRVGETMSMPLSAAVAGEARRLRIWEQELAGRASYALAVSAHDAASLGPDVRVIRHCVDVDSFIPPGPEASPRKDIVFTGNLGYRPNAEAAWRLAREIFPYVCQQVPEARLRIVGPDPRGLARELASERITVTGFVPDIVAELHGAAAAAAPVNAGGGVKTKVLEAMACGAPVVATSEANRGIEAIPGKEILIGDNAEEFARHVVEVLQNRERAAALGKAGRELVVRKFSWRQVGQELLTLYEELGSVEGRCGRVCSTESEGSPEA